MSYMGLGESVEDKKCLLKFFIKILMSKQDDNDSLIGC